MTGRQSSATGRVFDRLAAMQLVVCELLIVGVVVLVTAEVVCRQFLNFSLEFPYEVSGYILVWVTFLGLGMSLRENGLFRVEFLYAAIPPRIRAGLQLVYDVVCLAFSLILDYQLMALVVSSYTRDYREATTLATPLYLPQLVMPIGVTLMIAVLVTQIARGASAVFGHAGDGARGPDDLGR